MSGSVLNVFRKVLIAFSKIVSNASMFDVVIFSRIDVQDSLWIETGTAYAKALLNVFVWYRLQLAKRDRMYSHKNIYFRHE